MSEASSSVPRLSLCMIVRDEAELLPTFIDRARGLWDELIVVDTGSKDNTKALLQDAGAQVYDRPWDDDFAAARNAAIEHASGDFILSLDADEFVSDEFKQTVRALILDETVGGATVTMRNHLPHGHHRDAPLLRLFRRVEGVRYRSPIHEEVASTLLPYLSEHGLRLAHVEGVINHEGYVRERAAGRGKKDRDLRILNKCLMDDPSDVYSHYKRLELARYWDDNELWKAAADESEALLKTQPTMLQGQHFGGDFLVMLAQTKPAHEALAFLTAHEQDAPPSAEFHYYRGQLLEADKAFEEAAKEYARCMEVEGVRNVQMGTVRPLMGLCRVAMAKQDLASAQQFAEQAMAHVPTDPEVLLAMASLHYMTGEESVQQFIADYTAEHEAGGNFWLAMGNAGMVYGDVPGAIAAYGKAAGDPPAGRPAMHLAKAIMRSGDFSRAREVLRPLLATIPEAGIATLVCEMCLDQDSDLNLELSEAEADSMLREWIVAALFGANNEVLTNLSKRVPSVQHVFPWLPEALGLAA